MGRNANIDFVRRRGMRMDSVPRKAVAATASWLLALMPMFASAGDIVVKPVQFAKGASSATMQGRISGDQTVDYTLRAKAGQAMTVTLETRHPATYFNVLPPQSETALFVGSTSGNAWSGALPGDGLYRVRVYLMRSAARRGESAAYTLKVGVTGTAVPAAKVDAPSVDAKVKGTPFHATGPLPCALGDKPAQCQFGVIRKGPDAAEVHITPQGGLKRVLRFAGGQVSATDGSKIRATKTSDTWHVVVNDFEHYTVSESVINGG